MWTNEFRQLDMSGLRASVDCPTCSQQQFKWLSGDRESQSAVLCGRNAVQISPPQDALLSGLTNWQQQKRSMPSTLGHRSYRVFLDVV